MTARRTATCLWSAAAAFAAGAVAVLAAAFYIPIERPTATSIDTFHIPPATRAAQPLPPLAAFEPLLAMDLRKPLIDPAPRPAAPEPPVDTLAAKASALPVRLAGTVLEPSRSIAIFITDLARIEIRGEGETVAGAEVVSIAADRVTLRSRGKNRVLKVQRLPRDAAGTPLTAGARDEGAQGGG